MGSTVKILLKESKNKTKKKQNKTKKTMNMARQGKSLGVLIWDQRMNLNPETELTLNIFTAIIENLHNRKENLFRTWDRISNN